MKSVVVFLWFAPRREAAIRRSRTCARHPVGATRFDADLRRRPRRPDGRSCAGALHAGGKVVGVIPSFMSERELALRECTELIEVDSMHTRKARMAQLADAFIALPGGFGTFDELFEILTWSQIGLHGKPVGILNTAGYYDGLRQFLGTTVSEGFVRAGEFSKLQFADTPTAILDKLAATPALPGRWEKADLVNKT